MGRTLTTVEFKPTDAGTRLVYTEQCAFIDGLDSKEDHILGAKQFLNDLALELERTTE